MNPNTRPECEIPWSGSKLRVYFLGKLIQGHTKTLNLSSTKILFKVTMLSNIPIDFDYRMKMLKTLWSANIPENIHSIHNLNML